LATKTNKQFEEEKYFPALTTLDELEENLKNINRYEFTTYFEQYINITKEKIKKNVVRKFNDWLVRMKDIHNSRKKNFYFEIKRYWSIVIGNNSKEDGH
jgi:hypothetical protein